MGSLAARSLGASEDPEDQAHGCSGGEGAAPIQDRSDRAIDLTGDEHEDAARLAEGRSTDEYDLGERLVEGRLGGDDGRRQALGDPRLLCHGQEVAAELRRDAGAASQPDAAVADRYVLRFGPGDAALADLDVRGLDGASPSNR